MEHKARLSLARALLFLYVPKFSNLILHVLVENPFLCGHVIHRYKSVVANKHKSFFLAEAVVKSNVVFHFDLCNLFPVFFDHAFFTDFDHV